VTRYNGVVGSILLGSICNRAVVAAAEREETPGALEQGTSTVETEERAVSRKTRSDDGRARLYLRPHGGADSNTGFLLRSCLEDNGQLLIRVEEAHRGTDNAKDSQPQNQENLILLTSLSCSLYIDRSGRHSTRKSSTMPIPKKARRAVG
jgi:hypothetical protein